MDSSHAAESFRSFLLRHRGRTGLVQRELAARVGVSLRSVQDWESGVTYPTAERLQALIRVLLEAGGLTAGEEEREARNIWTAAEREASRMHTPFDEDWFARLLDARAATAAQPRSKALQSVAAAERRSGALEPAQDWGEAPDVLGFVGRDHELALLRRWVLAERCRMVAVLGMGGIGKTSLAARLAREVAPEFERTYWRSLRDAPPVTEWLAGAIGFLSDQQLVPPQSVSEAMATLLQLLRKRRCLLVLDNSEALFESGQQEGRYRAGMDGYGRLFLDIGEASHWSSLMLTSREAPPELALLGRAVRTLTLGGLGVDEAQVLLAAKNLSGTSQEWAELNTRFGGNGLALRLVGETIREVLGGDIGLFLHEAGSNGVFGGIRRLLAE
jgi:transcriptional regulator with XRE-family HTH domain